MLLAPFRVVLDANVLYPFSLRDTLLLAAGAGFYQVYWSEQILDEALRNLIDDEQVTPAQADRLRAAMEHAFPEASVAGHEPLIASMPNADPDRHVAAVAVKVGAQVIVTNNLRDFRTLPNGVEAQSPDEFLCNLVDLDPANMVALVHEQAAALKRPPRSFEELLAGLAKLVPDFVDALRTNAQCAH
jgi:predicted nucleic acid-binding protein